MPSACTQFTCFTTAALLLLYYSCFTVIGQETAMPSAGTQFTCFTVLD